MSNFHCQPLLDRLTHVLIKSGLLKSYKCLHLLDDKIKFCLSDKNIKYDDKIFFNIRNEITNLLEALYKISNSHGKSEKLGEEFKSKGSKAYLKKKDIEAHKLYTEGLRHAPTDSKCLPLLYANRSAALYQMNRYEDCLLDIERAIQSGYPIESQYKLSKRRIEAFIKLGMKDEAVKYTQEDKKNLENIPLISQEAKSVATKLMESLTESIEKMEISNKNLLDHKKSTDETSIPVTLFKCESQSVSQMSGALDLRVNSKEGRHIMAIEDIPKGSVVFAEKPYASILLPEYFLTHCQNCFVIVQNPIPCDYCSDIIWCSSKCKEEGEIYHKYECKILHILTGVGIAHLALRIVLVAGWQTCFMTRSQYGSTENVPLQIFKQGDKVSRYQAVYSLLTHLTETVVEDQFQYALAAIILGKAILDRTTFFLDQVPPEYSNSDSDILVDLCCIIMHHIAQLVSNAHAITQVDESSENDVANICRIAQKRIASAIYPSASLMNHSCMPAIINCFHKDLLIIHAIKEIKSGEQVYNCYGPHANRQDRDERQSSLLKQYFFKCQCPPCTQDKFLIREASWNGLICPNCNGIAVWEESLMSAEDGGLWKCLTCNLNGPPPEDTVEKCSSVNQLFQEGEEALSIGDLCLAEKYLSDALRIGVKVYAKDNHFLSTIRDTLAKVLASQGKYAKSLAQLSHCLETVKSRFGEDSIEVAHELIKYQDIANLLPCQELRKDETEDLRKKVKEIFSIHFGKDWMKFLKMDPF